MHMYMYTVNVFINEDSFMVYKDMFFVRVAKHVMCDTGIACLYTALQCQYVHILSLIVELLHAKGLQVKPLT